jgi:hypothetical protein
MQDNLERLKRSLKKTANGGNGMSWADKDWDNFLTGYGA